MTKTTRFALAASLLAWAAGSAAAQSSSAVFSNEWTGDLSRHSIFLGFAGLLTPFEEASDFSGLPAGSSSDLDDSLMLGFAYNYALNDHVELQLQLGSGFETNLRSEGAFLAGVPTLGKIDIYPPQTYLLYNFQGPEEPFRFFAGAGLGYAVTTNERVTNGTRALAGADATFSVSDELFWALTVGMERQLTERLSLRLQVNYNRISVDTVLTSSALPVPLRQDVDVNPLLVAIGLKYRF